MYTVGGCWLNNILTTMTQSELIDTLHTLKPKGVVFKPGESYVWSPRDKTVFYQEKDRTTVGQWTLLHELSHALLEHSTYQSDFELVQLEMQAWEKARELALEIKLKIDEDHIQDCIDSYRDWQYKRSLCPNCELGGIQTDQRTYTCLFCDGSWHVSEARFCRPYRRKIS